MTQVGAWCGRFGAVLSCFANLRLTLSWAFVELETWIWPYLRLQGSNSRMHNSERIFTEWHWTPRVYWFLPIHLRNLAPFYECPGIVGEFRKNAFIFIFLLVPEHKKKEI